MLTSYTTKRLELRLLNGDSWKSVLDFLIKNRNYFEPLEPLKAPNFYSGSYQRASLTYEYNTSIQQTHIRYWLFEQDNPDRIIGTVSFQQLLRGSYNCANIGYKIDHDFCNMGYAFEALTNCIDIMFTELGLHRITAHILPSNAASIHLAEKLGFLYEGIAFKNICICGVWENHLQYSLISDKKTDS